MYRIHHFGLLEAAKLKGIKIVAMLQDVWPDNAVQSHLISQGSLLYRYFEMWQRYVYKNADRIICISDDMKKFIVSKNVSAEKIDVIYNWGYSDEAVNIPWEKNKFVNKFELDREKFYAIYAGNIGKMQNVEVVVNAAKELQNREDIHFLIIGDGARRDAIENMARGLNNITMLPMQPRELAVHIYSAAGVNIIPLVAGGTKTAMPSKTGVILSCGQPAVFCFDASERFISMVKKNKVGDVVAPENYKELAKIICKYSENSPAKNFDFFVSTFGRTKNIRRYINIVNNV